MSEIINDYAKLCGTRATMDDAKTLPARIKAVLEFQGDLSAFVLKYPKALAIGVDQLVEDEVVSRHHDSNAAFTQHPLDAVLAGKHVAGIDGGVDHLRCPTIPAGRARQLGQRWISPNELSKLQRTNQGAGPGAGIATGAPAGNGERPFGMKAMVLASSSSGVSGGAG